MTEDDPDVQAEAERRYNIFYRCILDETVPFTENDFDLLPQAHDYLTDTEKQQLGDVSLKIEMEGREGLDFEEVTDREREYIRIIKQGIDRYRENNDGSE